MPKVAFRQIRSRGVQPEWAEAVKEPRRVVETKSKPELLALFRFIVSDWESDVDFGARVSFDRKVGISLYVFPKGDDKEIWGYVSGGTRAHTITARRAPRLKFRTGYFPKTLPANAFFKGPGIATGEYRSPLSVNHPGTKAREFERQIMEDYKPEFTRDMENAFRRGFRSARRKGKGKSGRIIK